MFSVGLCEVGRAQCSLHVPSCSFVLFDNLIPQLGNQEISVFGSGANAVVFLSNNDTSAGKKRTYIIKHSQFASLMLINPKLWHRQINSTKKMRSK